MKTATRDIETTLSELRSNIERLQSDIRKQAEAVGERLAVEAPALAERARAAFEEGSDRVRGLADAGRKLWDDTSDTRESFRVAAQRAGGRIVEAAEVADHGSRQTVAGLRRFVERRPLASVLLAVGAGLLLARTFDRD